MKGVTSGEPRQVSTCCAVQDFRPILFCIRRHSVLEERIAIAQIDLKGVLTIGSHEKAASIERMSNIRDDLQEHGIGVSHVFCLPYFRRPIWVQQRHRAA